MIPPEPQKNLISLNTTSDTKSICDVFIFVAYLSIDMDGHDYRINFNFFRENIYNHISTEKTF